MLLAYVVIFILFALAVTFMALWLDGDCTTGFFHPRLILDDTNKLTTDKPAKYKIYLQMFGGQAPVNLFDDSTLGIVPKSSHWSKPVWMYDGVAIGDNLSSGKASPGVKDMAERGVTSTLVAEQKAIGRSTLVTDGLDKMYGVFPVAEITLTKTTDLQVVSMLAPSPDWFLYGRLQVAQSEPGTHWENYTFAGVGLFDAGTDSGVTATADDAVENPQKDISELFDPPVSVGLIHAVRVA